MVEYLITYSHNIQCLWASGVQKQPVCEITGWLISVDEDYRFLKIAATKMLLFFLDCYIF